MSGRTTFLFGVMQKKVLVSDSRMAFNTLMLLSKKELDVLAKKFHVTRYRKDKVQLAQLLSYWHRSLEITLTITI